MLLRFDDGDVSLRHVALRVDFVRQSRLDLGNDRRHDLFQTFLIFVLRLAAERPQLHGGTQ